MSIKDIKNKYLKHRKKQRISRRLDKLNYKFIAGMGASTSLISSLAVQSSQLYSNFSTTLNQLNSQRVALQNQVNQLPVGDLSLRSRGVGLAWDYEQALLELGGSGTRSWSNTQQQEIISSGRVRGMEGHHINSVAEHPELQANPDNIDFLSRSEHLEAHGGDWRHPTTGEIYSREALMRMQVIRSELVRFGQSALLGFGIAFTIAIFDSKLDWKSKLKQGMEGAVMGILAYGGGRLAGAVLTSAFGSNISSFSHIFGVGAGASIAMSAYIFYKIKKISASNTQAFKAASVNLGISLSGVFISSAAIWIFGGPAGVIAGVLFGGFLLIVNRFNKKKFQKLINDLKKYEIQLLRPAY